MAVEKSLRNRVAATFAIFGGMVSLGLATIIFLASHDLEQRLIDDTLAAELEDSITRRQRNPRSLPESTATIRAYVVTVQGESGPVPEAVQQLQPGRHSLVLDGVEYRASVRQQGQQRFAVLYNISALQQRETGFLLLLAASVLLVTLLSAVAGRWLAGRLIAPITDLIRRVAQQHPEQEPSPLADAYRWSEIRQLATDFDGYLRRLHGFIERERLFTGDVSHELRTPLAVIHGACELLLSDPQLEARNRKRVERIGRATAEMGEITAALLALAREQGNLPATAQELDPHQVLDEVIERYRELFRHRPVTLEVARQGTPLIQSDRAILAMVLGNLLRNAYSYTPEGKIVVEIDAAEIRVRDSGPGLMATERQQLFKPYMRGQHSTGAGLGLSLVWRLCERQGWQISLDNHVDGGSLARLRFQPMES